MSKLPRNPLQPGQRFGRLTVIEYTGRDKKSGKQLYRCRCDCGNEKTTQKDSLTSGKAKSCGCSRQKPETWVQPGQRFGKLTVIAYTGRDANYNKLYRCRCDCGNEAVIRKDNLTSGNSKSCGCGCLQKEIAGPLQPGQRFGKLTVIEYAGHDKYGAQLYRCRCDCGNETTVTKRKLTSGFTKSCGCLISEKIPIIFGFQDGTNISLIKLARPNKNNSTGVRGVSWNKRNGSFEAHLQFQGKSYRQRGFKTVDEAAKARQRMYDEIVQPYLDSLDAKEKAANMGGTAK